MSNSLKISEAIIKNELSLNSARTEGKEPDFNVLAKFEMNDSKATFDDLVKALEKLCSIYNKIGSHPFSKDYPNGFEFITVQNANEITNQILIVHGLDDEYDTTDMIVFDLLDIITREGIN